MILDCFRVCFYVVLSFIPGIFTEIILRCFIGVRLGFRQRVWDGLKGVFKDHHEGLRMERGMGYAPIGGRGAGGWVAAPDGQVISGGSRRAGSDNRGVAGNIASATGDNRAVFMMGT